LPGRPRRFSIPSIPKTIEFCNRSGIRFLAFHFHYSQFLLTEPDAGSDATSIQTLATEKNDQYIINGSKAWVTSGLLRENPLARQMSGARVTYYMDGTTEIQNVVIGRSLLE